MVVTGFKPCFRDIHHTGFIIIVIIVESASRVVVVCHCNIDCFCGIVVQHGIGIRDIILAVVAQIVNSSQAFHLSYHRQDFIGTVQCIEGAVFVYPVCICKRLFYQKPADELCLFCFCISRICMVHNVIFHDWVQHTVFCAPDDFGTILVFVYALRRCQAFTKEGESADGIQPIR